MKSTAAEVAPHPEGEGAMMTAFRLLRANMALLTGVAVGLVEGVTAATTPTGLAYLTMPFLGSSSITPTLRTLLRSRRQPKVLRWFLTILLSTSPSPVCATAI